MASRGDQEVRPTAAPTPEDFEAFFDAVWPRAQATVRRMGLTVQEAQDVALDALAVTFDRWSRVRSMTYKEAWTLKVAANLALRQLKRRPPQPGLNEAGPAEAYAVPVEPYAVPVEEDVTERMELRRALERLPRRQREVIFLRYLADLPEQEVAGALGIDVGSVKQHATRGRAALKKSLGGDEQGGFSAE